MGHNFWQMGLPAICKRWAVTPRWPQANGEVERQNQSLEKRMKITQAEGGDWKQAMQTYLLTYRATPHSTTGKIPAELLFGRKIRTKLPHHNPQLLDLETRDRDTERKGMAKWYADLRRNAQESDIQPRYNVLLRRQTQGKLDTAFLPKPYQVTSRTGSQVTVEARAGQHYTRNTSQVKRYYDETQPDEEDQGQGLCREPGTENQGKETVLTELAQAQCDPEVSGSPKTWSSKPRPVADSSLTPARPKRERKMPERFTDFVMN